LNRPVAIITGATGGLGRAAMFSFARAGYRVVGVYGHDEPSAQQAVTDGTRLGLDLRVLRHDFEAETSAPDVSVHLEGSSRIVLVNAAWPPFTPQPFHLQAWAEVERALHVGVRGSWACCASLLRPMLAREAGTIVNVLTAAVEGPPPKGFAGYLTAKHALRGMTLALAAECASKGIRVFSVSPGYMPTRMTDGWDPRFQEAARQARSTDPETAAARLVELVANPPQGGRGENYPL
jgi:3-oxoacyl-[acyl-carrier protein] reductase